MDFDVEPAQCGNCLVRIFTLAIIHFAVGLEWAVKHLTGPVDVYHQLSGGVPGIHQNGSERQFFAGTDSVKHVPHMIEFGFLVAVRVINTPINDPVFIGIL